MCIFFNWKEFLRCFARSRAVGWRFSHVPIQFTQKICLAAFQITRMWRFASWTWPRCIRCGASLPRCWPPSPRSTCWSTTPGVRRLVKSGPKTAWNIKCRPTTLDTSSWPISCSVSCETERVLCHLWLEELKAPEKKFSEQFPFVWLGWDLEKKTFPDDFPSFTGFSCFIFFLFKVLAKMFGHIYVFSVWLIKHASSLHQSFAFGWVTFAGETIKEHQFLLGESNLDSNKSKWISWSLLRGPYGLELSVSLVFHFLTRWR